MTQKEKELLLKDLCARLPYGVKLYVKGVGGCSNTGRLLKIDNILEDNNIFVFIDTIGFGYILGHDEIKPYLRPMSSMTKKEKEQFEELTYNEHEDFETTTDRRMILATDSDTGYGSEYFSEDISEVVDWLNSHHIDYRGLIEKGLALEAPSDMYNN